MEKRSFQTPLGEVWVWGEPGAFEPGKPLVLVIAGAFAAERGFFSLPGHLPEASVMVVHQPGNHSPKLAATSVGAFGLAYSSLIDQLARPVIVCGSSAGALVALALKSRHIVGQLLIEPPLRPTGIPALADRMRAIAATGPNSAEYVENFFGFTAEGSSDRDYTHLVGQIRVQTRALIGSETSGTADLPSLVTSAERLLLARHPVVKATIVTGAGHNIPVEGGAYIVAALRALLNETGVLEPATADQAPLAREGAG